MYRVIKNIIDNNLETKIEDGKTFLLIGEKLKHGKQTIKGDLKK